MLDKKEIDIEIARLEYSDSSYANYAKLADLYMIRNQMNKKDFENEEANASYMPEYPLNKEVDLYGDSEFLQAISGKPESEVWGIMDELMETLKVTNQRAYNVVMRKIERTNPDY